MSKIDDLAEWLSPKRLETGGVQETTSTITGTAVSDSKNGFVDVVIGDDTITYDDGGISLPMATTVQVKKGDSVIILLTGANLAKEARVIGVLGRGDETAQDIANADAKADSAGKSASAAQQTADTAKRAADNAQEAIDATNQHFFTDDNGVHVSTVENNGNRGPNLLANSKGVLLRNDDKILTAQTTDGFAVYDGKGNEEENVLAVFSDSIRIGSDNDFHMTVDNDSIDITSDNDTVVHIGNDFFSYGAEHEQSEQGRNSVRVGRNNQATGIYAFSGGYLNNAPGNYSFSYGRENSAEGNFSFCSGYGTRSTNNSCAAFGRWNKTTNALFVIGNGTSEDDRRDVFIVSNAGQVNATGRMLDTPETGDAIRVGNCSAGSWASYIRTGHIVDVMFFVAPSSTVAAYGQLKNLLRGLPKAQDDSVGYIAKIDGTTGTCLVHISATGYFWMEARETPITSGTHIIGRFSYVSVE